MEKKINMSKITKNILLALVWLVYLIICYLLIRIYLADVLFKKSQISIETESDRVVLKIASKAISLNPYEPNYYRGRAKINIVRSLPNTNTPSTIKREIITDLQKAYYLNPNNLVTIRNSIPLYYFLAVKDINLPTGVENIDSEYAHFTRDFFKLVKKIYWNDTGVVASVAKYEKKLGFDYDYEVSVERIKVLRPDLLEWNEAFR
jgi:hypothetical protein